MEPKLNTTDHAKITAKDDSFKVLDKRKARWTNRFKSIKFQSHTYMLGKVQESASQKKQLRV